MAHTAFKPIYSLKISGDPLAEENRIVTADPLIGDNSNLVVDGFYATAP